LHIGKTNDKTNLGACCRGFPPARQGTILNSHLGIGITNASMVLKCALMTYTMMTADVGLPDAV